MYFSRRAAVPRRRVRVCLGLINIESPREFRAHLIIARRAADRTRLRRGGVPVSPAKTVAGLIRLGGRGNFAGSLRGSRACEQRLGCVALGYFVMTINAALLPGAQGPG